MTRRPTRSTRTDTLFPYTTLFRSYLDRIIEVMMDCVDRGMRTEGVLPGRLTVQRRARGLRQKLDTDRFRNRLAPHALMDHVSLFALAVNEENGTGGRIGTAPTKGR